MALKQVLDALYLKSIKSITRTGLAADLGAAFPVVTNLFRLPGDIILLGIYGRVMFAKQNTAQTLRLGLLPALPAPGAVEAFLCAASGATNLDVADSIYTISGLSTDAMIVAQIGPPAAGGIGRWQSGVTGIAIGNPLILVAGIIRLTTGGADDNVGLINWTITYQPLSDASIVTVM